MVVEDEISMVRLYKLILGFEGYHIIGVAKNGKEAVNMSKNFHVKPDVVLMDVFIKGINGVEATRMIKEFDPYASIVVLTSSLNNKIKNEMTAMDVDEYLIKPVTKIQLINSLEQSLARKKGMII